ncbi:MAG: DUF1476 domain-containing protein [Paracoccaceae bacterium]|jgi:hypothetical protein|nr:DUF1476 domain-containing protein [Paracoccaceae bacterium]
MTTFDDRESAFENKFAHDAEMEFKAESLRNKLIAYWACELMGRSAEDAAGYAKEVIRADFIAPGHDDVVQKLVADLGDLADEATIRAKMAEFLEQARRKVREGS